MPQFPSRDQFIELAERVLRSLPEGICSGLNGGIIVQDEKLYHPRAGRRALLLGQYVYEPNGLGRYILLFYGSFRAMYGNEGRAELEKQLKKTICHELLHHWENLSGTRDLANEDIRRLREIMS